MLRLALVKKHGFGNGQIQTLKQEGIKEGGSGGGGGVVVEGWGARSGE